MMSFVQEQDRQCMPCSINFPLTFEILSTVTSDFLKQIIILQRFNSVFHLYLHFLAITQYLVYQR